MTFRVRCITDFLIENTQPSLWASRVWGLFVCVFLTWAAGTNAWTRTPDLLVRSITPLENILTGMVAESQRSLLVLENDSGELSRLILNAGGDLQSITTMEEGLSDPIALAYLRDRSLVIAERSQGRILRLDEGVMTPLADDLGEISSIRLDPAGLILVSELDTGRVLRIHPGTGETEVLVSDHNFPSDAHMLDSATLITAELFGPQSILGRIARTPVNPFSTIAPEGWVIENGINDPTRLIRNPFNPRQLLVSLRVLKLPLTPTVGDSLKIGGIIVLDMATGQRQGTFIEGLNGPTDLVAFQDDLMVLEERAERISRIDASGNRQIIWDGLGEPTAFSYSPFRGGYLVAETLPETSVVHTTGSNTTPMFDGGFDSSVIGGIVSGVTTYISVPGRGEIHEVMSATESRILSESILAPEKLLLDDENRLWVSDRVLNEIIVLNATTGEPLFRIPSPTRQAIHDFDLSVDAEGNRTLFVLDHLGILHEWRGNPRNTNLYREIAVLSMESGTPSSNRPGPSFKAFGTRGFVIAANDPVGSLFWQPMDGSAIRLDTGFPNIVQMTALPNPNSFAVLSRNGWIRRCFLDFSPSEDNPTPTPPVPAPPTPTPPFTTVEDWQLFHNR